MFLAALPGSIALGNGFRDNAKTASWPSQATRARHDITSSLGLLVQPLRFPADASCVAQPTIASASKARLLWRSIMKQRVPSELRRPVDCERED